MVREINIQPASESREANAERKIAAGGPRFSVFGARHNDHTWLEVFDPDSGRWFPADPAVGVVGLDRWIRARLALEQRTKPAVPAVVPIVEAMLEPFAVVVVGDPRVDRDGDVFREQSLGDFARLGRGKFSEVPQGFEWHRSRQVARTDLFDRVPEVAVLRDEIGKAERQVGSLGGGNHFLELQVDPDSIVWVMVHSGSRNVGKQMADYYDHPSSVRLGLNLVAYSMGYFRVGQAHAKAQVYSEEDTQANTDPVVFAPDRPVYLTRVDGHAGWANARALDGRSAAADGTSRWLTTHRNVSASRARIGPGSARFGHWICC